VVAAAMLCRHSTPPPPACAHPAAKAKSLHALALTPASDLPPDQLSAQPEGATASPYGEDHLPSPPPVAPPPPIRLAPTHPGDPPPPPRGTA
jgi:hypothetical protein